MSFLFIEREREWKREHTKKCSTSNLIYKVDTRRRSTMLYDVVSTLKRRCVPTGTKYITWYTRYMISSVTFNFWKIWHNDYKCDIPSISHAKHGLTNHFLASSPFPCCITLVHRYSSVTFAQYKVPLFNHYEKHTGNWLWKNVKPGRSKLIYQVYHLTMIISWWTWYIK